MDESLSVAAIPAKFMLMDIQFPVLLLYSSKP